MATRFLQVLTNFGCAHEFSWPRRFADGEYYQVCLRCGAEYLYDWSSMQRTRKNTRPSQPGRRPARVTTIWKPRARRLSVMLEVTFRAPGAPEWRQATIRNVSKSGVMIETGEPLPAASQVEMIFVMPKEISGQDGRKVVCSGHVVRVVAGKQETVLHHMAVAISDYRFLHK